MVTRMFELKRVAALVATLTLVSITACGHAAKPTGAATTADPGVATLRSGAATAQPSPSIAVDERPLIRVDTTGEEAQKLWTAWGQCLRDRGVNIQPEKPSTEILAQPQNAGAVSACAAKRPETFMERDARTDPAYADHFRAYIQCIRDKGIKVDTGADGNQVIFTDDRQVSRGPEVLPPCERQAFNER
jgi:hypothetical protein